MVTIIYDLETTGLVRRDDYAQPLGNKGDVRLVQLSWIIVSPLGQRSEPITKTLVMGEIPIEPQAAAIHGITAEIANQTGEDRGQVLRQFLAALEGCKLAVCHAGNFKKVILLREFHLLGLTAGVERLEGLHHFDTMLDPWFRCQDVTKWPKLSDLYRQHFGLRQRGSKVSAIGDIYLKICGSTGPAPVRRLFHQAPYALMAHHIPWILNLGAKTPEEAVGYLHTGGAELNPDYYPAGQQEIEEKGEDATLERRLADLFSPQRSDPHLSAKAGVEVFRPQDCLSGIFNLAISDQLSLLAYVRAVSRGPDRLIIIENTSFLATNAEIRVKLLTSMAVWEAQRGICLEYGRERMRLDFEPVEWTAIVEVIRQWAQRL